MSDILKAMAASAGGMTAQSARLRVTAENIANADTPGYRRKMLTFEQAAGAESVRVGQLMLDRSEPERIYDPSHPLADAEGYHEGSTVELMIEVADAREAQRSYEANLKMLDQARQMTGALLELLRR